MEELDLLESKLEQAETPLQKAETLVDIAWYLSPCNPALALEQLQDAMSLFEPAAQSSLWTFLQIARSSALIRMGKPEDGFAILQTIHTAVNTDDRQMVARLFSTLLLYHFLKGNRQLALKGIDTPLSLLDSLDPHDQAMVQHLIGSIYADLESNYPVAFKYYAQGLTVAREAGDLYYSFIIPVSLAEGFLVMGDTGSALMYLREGQQNLTPRARSLCRTGYVHLLSVLGKAHLQKGSFDKALESTLESIELEPDDYPRPLHGSTINNLGNIYLQKQDLLLAEDCFRQLQEMNGPSSSVLLAHGLLGLGRVSLARGHLVDAISRLLSAIQAADDNNLPVIQMQAHEEIARACAQRSEWEQAYEHQQKFHAFWVKNNDAGADRRTKTMEMMYKLAAAQSETDLAIQKNQALELELRQRRRAQEITQQRVKELEALRSTMEEIFSELELPNLMQKVVTRAVHLLDAQVGELSLYDAAQNILEVKASWPEHHGEVEPGMRLLSIQTHDELLDLQPHIVTDYTAWELHNPENDLLAGNTILFVPLVRGSQFYGTLLVGTQADHRHFSSEELILLELFAHQVVLAIQNARLYSGVRHLAVTDPLTGIPNRRAFFDNARGVLNFAHLQDQPVSLLMLDVDSFKNVNDTYGHKAGDLMLEAIAQYMRSHMRVGDLCGRIGGEEFAILLPGSDESRATAIAERFRAGIADLVVDMEGKPISVTVSIGVAATNGGRKSLDALFVQSDRAMYCAKHAGRNRVSAAVEDEADPPH